MIKQFCDKCKKEYESRKGELFANDPNETNIIYPAKRYNVQVIEIELTMFQNDSLGYRYNHDLDLCPKCRADLSDIVMKFIGIADGVSE